jgi:AGZA family xanthine/uracil permease-like MFS transporter
MNVKTFWESNGLILRKIVNVVWFFAPIFLAIPGFATAPALIIVGFLMIKSTLNIPWDDVAGAMPAYLLITGIVFTYSISEGLGIGVISYVILNCRIKNRVSWLLVVIALLFVLKYFTLR